MSASPRAEDQDASIGAAKLLEARRDIFKFIWTAYLSWYTFFSTLNLVALSLSHQFDQALPLVAPIFAIFNALGVVTSLGILHYSRRAAALLNSLEAAVSSLSTVMAIGSAPPLIPSGLTGWAAAANALSLSLFATAWISLVLAT